MLTEIADLYADLRDDFLYADLPHADLPSADPYRAPPPRLHHPRAHLHRAHLPRAHPPRAHPPRAHPPRAHPLPAELHRDDLRRDLQSNHRQRAKTTEIMISLLFDQEKPSALNAQRDEQWISIVPFDVASTS